MEKKTFVYKIDSLPEVEIDTFFLSISSSLLYVSLPYLRMLQAFLECEVVIPVVYHNNEIVGAMPLAFKHNETHGCVCNSLPFYGSNGGMIVKDSEHADDIRQSLLEVFYELIKENKCISYTVISNPLDSKGNEWVKQNIEHNLIDERIGQITHFPEGTDIAVKLLQSYENPRPRNIRKAQKEGVKVYASNAKDAMDFLYKTHYDNITAINGVPKEKRFFEMIPEFFSEDIFKVYIAELNGEMIAGLLLFYYNDTVEYFTPAVVEKFRNTQPTTLIIYIAMQDAIARGYKNWNWGGTWLSQGGVYDFKKKWGTSDYRYFYYSQVDKVNIFNMSKNTLLEQYPYFFVLPFNKLKS